MFFDNTAGILRVLVIGPIAYLWLILVLRITGKRTLAQLNAFDFIITVALGSTLATVVLSKGVAFAEGALALALLALLQLVAAWACHRIATVRRVLTSEPTVLLRDGKVLSGALRSERITEHGVRQAVRSAGVGGLELVAAVVLETNGKLSVITTSQLGTGDALVDLPTVEHPAVKDRHGS